MIISKRYNQTKVFSFLIDTASSCRETEAYTCNSRANWSMFYIRAIDCRNSLHVRFALYIEHARRANPRGLRE